MRAPGGLRELGPEGEREWSERVSGTLRRLVAKAGPNPFLRPRLAERTSTVTTVDWPGLPARVTACLTRADAMPLLDRGARGLQEEYLEWRVVREGNAIRRVELTTELSDYWRVLAAHQPARTLELVAGFARRERVAPADVYGDRDPLRLTPLERERAFAARMLGADGMSSYNDGRAAICCMVQRTNTLEALLALVVAATTPRVVRDVVSGRQRCMTCDEAIPMMAGGAVSGRASDPLLVERLGRLAFEGRPVALDRPVGVAIAGVEHTRLRTRDGDAVPLDWFRFGRSDTPSRHQRLVLEPPPGSGLQVSDLIDAATEQPIRHGGQIAELAQVAVFVRAGAADTVPVELPEPGDCDDVRREQEAFAER